jgi:hypothetical protein
LKLIKLEIFQSYTKMFLSIDVMESSREFDDLFQLTKRSEKQDGGYKAYVWKYDKPKFFKLCDTTKVFPMAVNLYLKTCTEEELSELLNKEHFLRIEMAYEGEDCDVSCISVQNLTISDLHDEKYKELMLKIRNIKDEPSEIPTFEQIREPLIPCEINLGPSWHMFGASKFMCTHRLIENGMHVVSLGRMPAVGYIMGLELIGRDPHPFEDTEEKIKDAEESDGIFIVRK